MCFAVHSHLLLPINSLVGYPSSPEPSAVISVLAKQEGTWVAERAWCQGDRARLKVGGRDLDPGIRVAWAVTLLPEPRFPHQHEGYNNHSPSQAVMRGTRDHTQAKADCPGRL